MVGKPFQEIRDTGKQDDKVIPITASVTNCRWQVAVQDFEGVNQKIDFSDEKDKESITRVILTDEKCRIIGSLSIKNWYEVRLAAR